MWTLHHVRHWSESTGSVDGGAPVAVERLPGRRRRRRPSAEVEMPVCRIGKRPGTRTPSVVMPTKGFATASSPNRSRSRSRPGSSGLWRGRQRRHPSQAELLVVDQGHGAPSFASRVAKTRPRARPLLARTSSRRCSPSRTRTHAPPLRARRPRHRPRSRRATLGLRSLRAACRSRGLQLGCARRQPAREREVTGAEEDRGEVARRRGSRPSGRGASTSSSCTPRTVCCPRAR